MTIFREQFFAPNSAGILGLTKLETQAETVENRVRDQLPTLLGEQ